MKIAVIGAGVAGLGAAWSLSSRNEVVVYERESRFGGHSCTVDVPTARGPMPVDVGFIVYNERNYPNLVALFEHLGVATEESEMSFAVSLDGGRFEYASSYGGYLAQRRNVVRPSFLRMTRDILRFNRLAPTTAFARRESRLHYRRLRRRAPRSAMNFATAIWCRWPRASGRRRSGACSTIRRRPSHASSTITAC